MRCRCLLACLALLGTSSSAWTVESEDVIKYRSSVMKAYAGHTAAAGRIIRGRVNYTDQLMIHVTAIRDIAMLTGKLFPEGSNLGETRSKEKIWSKPDEFSKSIKGNQQAAETLYKAAQAGTADVKTFRALTDTCKNCHEKFRMTPLESSMRR